MMPYSNKIKTLLLLQFLLFSLISLYSQDLYWEDPVVLVESGVSFAKSSAGGGLIAVVWQETSWESDTRGIINLSIQTSRNGTTWKENKNIIDPFEFTGKETQMFSMAVDNYGKILLVVAAADNSMAVYESRDQGSSFKKISEMPPFSTSVTPRLFLKEGGGLLLFITQELESIVEEVSSLGIYYSLSSEGKEWDEFLPFVTEKDLKGNFLPFHTSYKGKEYVVFQVFVLGRSSTFQLYLKISEDGGKSWNQAKLLTGFSDSSSGYDLPYSDYNNQRPFIISAENKLFLSWERSYSGMPAQIYFMQLDSAGNIQGEPEKITKGSRSCKNPQIVFFNGKIFILWFDNRAGDYHVILSVKEGIFWKAKDLTYLIKGASTFGNIIQNKENIYVLWENELSNKTRLVLLNPDKSVLFPEAKAVNFSFGRPAKQDNYIIRWNSPKDSSGILGYSFSWDRNRYSPAPEKLMILDRDRIDEKTIKEDGDWYFHLAAQDYAGNWSDTVTVSFKRDTTPPGKVEFKNPQLDSDGFLVSNTIDVGWIPPDDPYPLTYTYNVQYLASYNYQGDTDSFYIKSPYGIVATKTEDISLKNKDNGLWALSVCAIDSVGNIGEKQTLLFRMNKYIPVTYITNVSARPDDLGRINLKIEGRGFAVGGLITDVILDLDGNKPYDFIFSRNSGLFQVQSDRIITGPVIDDIEKGQYKIGLIHPERGLYFTRTRLILESQGTVKFGDFQTPEIKGWKSVKRSIFSLSFNKIMLFLLMVFLVLTLIFSSLKIRLIVREGQMLEKEAKALIAGTVISSEKKKERIIQMEKRGMGLRIKFALLVTLLVLVVVLMVAIPLGYYMTKTQQENLASGLKQRTKVMLESLTSGARTYMPSRNTLELGLLPDQMSAMGSDALSVTITGAGIEGSIDYNTDYYGYIWATNNSELLKEGRIIPGEKPLNDEISGEIENIKNSINVEAEDKVAGIVTEIKRLNKEVQPLVAEFIRTGDKETENAIDETQDQIRILDKEMNKRLGETGSIINSMPVFDPETINSDNTNYIFYKPIVYRSNKDNLFFRGIVRLLVSTEGILKEIEKSRNNLILIISGITLIAVLLGVFGAMILAAIIIRPINKLLQGVEIIRDTEDKEKLKNHIIDVKTRDEISMLADTVNQMTKGLVNAAVANKDLTLGKEVQKMFIPLDKDSSGKKLSTGSEENDKSVFFGYYEGAKGVSGDYFDFQKLDNKHYAIIKCDVAGKGIPASLIMIEVATIFLNHFRGWSAEKDGFNSEQLVYSINDLLEERGFEGRFAALTIVIFNIETGVCLLCNAGDNIVHIYDNEKKKMIIKTLPEAPASGVFPSDLVEMKNGFKQVSHKLKKGDIMFLFTDGIEEAKRLFRDDSFSRINCQEKELGEDERHDTHQKGSDGEELGIPRIQDILNAVYSGDSYRLYKYHNPMGDEEITFNFSNCKGTVEEAVIALVAVEKIFRIYPDTSATAGNRIIVDRKIDDFLKNHFDQYDSYFKFPVDEEADSGYISFTHLKEDEQYDDLTILGVRKK